MAVKPSSPAAQRNRNVILEVIGDEFRNCATVLEIGSGTGQHAVFFAGRMPWLTWQTSDLQENHAAIRTWLQDSELANVKQPILLDVVGPLPFNDRFDAVFSANTAHIMSIEAVECMFRAVAQCLEHGGRFCLYGPFNLGGEFTSDSNRDFDRSLRTQEPSMGIRNLEDLDSFGQQNGLQRKRQYAMPANNMIVLWQKHQCDRSEDGA